MGSSAGPRDADGLVPRDNADVGRSHGWGAHGGEEDGSEGALHEGEVS
jgi:hypothetical protein